MRRIQTGRHPFLFFLLPLACLSATSGLADSQSMDCNAVYNYQGGANGFANDVVTSSLGATKRAALSNPGAASALNAASNFAKSFFGDAKAVCAKHEFALPPLALAGTQVKYFIDQVQTASYGTTKLAASIQSIDKIMAKYQQNAKSALQSHLSLVQTFPLLTEEAYPFYRQSSDGRNPGYAGKVFGALKVQRQEICKQMNILTTSMDENAKSASSMSTNPSDVATFSGLLGTAHTQLATLCPAGATDQFQNQPK